MNPGPTLFTSCQHVPMLVGSARIHASTGPEEDVQSGIFGYVVVTYGIMHLQGS